MVADAEGLPANRWLTTTSVCTNIIVRFRASRSLQPVRFFPICVLYTGVLPDSGYCWPISAQNPQELGIFTREGKLTLRSTWYIFKLIDQYIPLGDQSVFSLIIERNKGKVGTPLPPPPPHVLPRGRAHHPRTLIGWLVTTLVSDWPTNQIITGLRSQGVIDNFSWVKNRKKQRGKPYRRKKRVQ